MSIEIKRRRGTTAQHAGFTGAVGELTIDTDKKTAVVHDNATAGGFPLLREDLSNASTIASFAKTILDDTSAGAVLTTLGARAYIQSMLDDADATAVFNTLGIPAFIQTLLNDVDEAAARATLGITSQPSGMIADFAMTTPPTGWLECDGSAKSRTAEAALFAAIGTTWGAGDGATTFNLPDFRGTVRRSWDHGKGLDSGRTFASYQADEVGSHRPGYGSSTLPVGSTAYFGGARTGTFYTDYSGGSETRMKNYAVLTCIKT